MKPALLLSSDRVFAWAVGRIVYPLGFSLEHVYTLPEARTRMARQRYDVLLLDVPREEEKKTLTQHDEGQTITIVFSDAHSADVPACKASTEKRGVYLLPKEGSVATALKNLLQKSEID